MQLDDNIQRLESIHLQNESTALRALHGPARRMTSEPWSLCACSGARGGRDNVSPTLESTGMLIIGKVVADRDGRASISSRAGADIDLAIRSRMWRIQSPRA